MQLSDQNILAALEQTLTSEIARDLKSRESQAALQIVVMGIRELLKRRSVSAEIAAKIAPEGREILGKMLGANKEEKKHCLSEDEQAPFEELDTLLQGMDEWARAFLDSRDIDGPDQKVALLKEAAEWELEFLTSCRDANPEKIHAHAVDTELPSAELEAFIKEASGQVDIEVRGLERIPGGMSKETYFFDLVSAQKLVPLVVRKSDASPALDKGIFNLRQEFELVQHLHKLDFIVPEPKWVGGEPDMPETAFYISERAVGSVAGTVFGGDEAIPREVLFDFAEHIAKLHSMPIDAFSDYIKKYEDVRLIDFDASQCVRYYLDWWRSYWEEFKRFSSPAESYLFDWLYKNLPDTKGKPSLIHGDLGLHNFLYKDEKVTAILDWEGSHFGDPAEDLAYVRKHIASYMPWDEFYAHYLRSGGREIDQSTFNYYDCLANTRNLVATNKVAARLREKGRKQDIKDLYLALEFIPEFMSAAMANTAPESSSVK